MAPKKLIPSVLVAAAMVFAATPAFGAAGDLDPSFGVGGHIETKLEVRASVVQPDGKILVTGDYFTPGATPPSHFAVLRFNPDGTPDDSFGQAGQVVLSLPGTASDIALQANLRIVVSGVYVPSDSRIAPAMALVRLRPDGTLDPSFGRGGVVIDPRRPDPTDDPIGADNVALASHGRIVVSGSALSIPHQVNTSFLAEYKRNGRVVKGYGDHGFATSPCYRIGDLTVQPDGRPIVVGSSYSTTPGFCLTRFKRSGAPDRSFGASGTVSVNLHVAISATGSAVVLSPRTGAIVAGGDSEERYGEGQGTLVRLRPSGSLDKAFGQGGIAKSAAADSFGALALQGRRIVAGGNVIYVNTLDETVSDWALMRFTTGGIPDSTFGTGGAVRSNFRTGGNQSYITAVTASSHSIIAAGVADLAAFGLSGGVIARYQA